MRKFLSTVFLWPLLAFALFGYVCLKLHDRAAGHHS